MLGRREMKFSAVDRFLNACLMHFTEALNATYGIMLYSRSEQSSHAWAGISGLLLTNYASRLK